MGGEAGGPERAGDFTLGDWLVQPSLGRISRGETLVKLRPQLVELLVCLARRAGQTLSKDEILETVWRHRFVAASGLGRCMTELRQALGDAVQHPRYIETISKRGYRVVAPVCWLPSPTPVERAQDEGIFPPPPAPASPSNAAPRSRRVLFWAAGAVACAAAITAAVVLLRPRQVPLGERGAIVLAFENRTSDAVFDEALPLALAVQLEQSPFLAVLPEPRVREELRYMGRGDVIRVSRTLATEVCQRAGAKAVLAGSIGMLGRHYVIGLDALACDDGRTLARQQVEVAGKEQVLDALGRAAAGIRARLGESVASIRGSDVPPMQATTSSLDALRAASLAEAERARGRDAEAVRLYREALDLDPSFALAHVRLGVHLLNLGRPGGAAEALKKAFALRDRVSLRERSYISSLYFSRVERDPFKAIDTLQAWRDGYPQDLLARMALSSLYGQVGRFEEARREIEQALRLDPRHTVAGAVRMEVLLALGHPDEARRVGEALVARNAANANVHQLLLVLAFRRGDEGALERELKWGTSTPSAATLFASSRAAIAAAAGRLDAAAREWGQLRESAERGGDASLAAQTLLDEAEARALGGQQREAVTLVQAALNRSREPGWLIRGAAVAGLAGNARTAERLAEEYRRGAPGPGSDPEHAPLATALIAMLRGRPAEAIERLAPLRQNEAGFRFGFLPTLARGLALERLGRSREAAAEYERILAGADAVTDRPIGALAQLHLARARAAGGDRDGAGEACRAFLAAWRRADSSLPVLREARRFCAPPG